MSGRNDAALLETLEGLAEALGTLCQIGLTDRHHANNTIAWQIPCSCSGRKNEQVATRSHSAEPQFLS